MNTLKGTEVRNRVLAPILLVDDDADDRYLSRHLIERTGTRHPIFTFDEGGEAIDYLNREWSTYPLARGDLPRLLFIDVKTTGLGGFGFLKWRALKSQFERVAVVILSGSDDMRDIERARELGATRYFTKHPGITTFSRIIYQAYGETDLFGITEDNTSAAPFFLERGQGTGAPFPSL